MKMTPFLIILTFVFSNCDQLPSSTSTPEISEDTIVTASRPVLQKQVSDYKNYTYEDIAGSTTKIAKWFDGKGNIIETGMMINGKKNGVWTYNIADTNFPFKLVSYVDDVQNGLYLELNNKGQTTIMAYFKNNILHGPWAKFRFGSAERSVIYVEGKKHGIYQEIDFKNGKITKETSYKNDKKDGFMRYYNPEGNVTVEYIYKNDKKISGGIVDQPITN